MTGESAILSEQPAPIGPGRLVLVVGPSGAGKDTLLGLAKAACAGDDAIVFPRRVVTREASVFEDNEQMHPDQFRQALAGGRFAAHWQAHGHSYALPAGINDDIRSGRTVVANVSRTVIGAMRRAYANVVVALVTAPPEILVQRLAMRARGSDGNIKHRSDRVVEDAPLADVTIINVGPAADHKHELLRVIKGG
jgi:ribose 1,5-bisphosphokinase